RIERAQGQGLRPGSAKLIEPDCIRRGCCKNRVRHKEALLLNTVVTDGILVGPIGQSVKEDAAAPANRGLAILERRPGNAHARGEIHLVTQMSLEFVTQA